MIRPLNEFDVEQFISIRSESLVKYPSSFGSPPNVQIDHAQTIRDLKAKSEENFILGYFSDNQQLMGIIGCIRESGIKFRHKAFIWGMYVRPELQGQQIGSQLLDACIGKISQVNGIEKIHLSVTNVSTQAIGLYQNKGFQVFGNEVNAMQWNKQSFDLIFMEKLLKS